MGGLEREQRTDTGGKMTEGDKSVTPNKVRVYSNRNNSSINQIIIRTLAEQI